MSLRLLLAGFLWLGFSLSFANERPNIVVIFTDDQGWNDIGCYGSEIPTPNIDSLARDGLKLTQFYAASSICTPSRYGLLTGRFPTRSQDQLLGALMFLEEGDAGRGLRQEETTYVSLLAEGGYRTALIGKWHLGHGQDEFWPTEHGFDTFFGHTGGCVDFFSLHYGTTPDWYRGRELVAPGMYATDAITQEAIRFLTSQSDDEAPFYLHVSYNAPHFGKAGNRETGGTSNVMQPKPEDLERVDASISDPLRRAFAAKVIGMDDSIGQILAQLDESGVAKNTLVVFMTDHGGDPEYGGSNLPLRGGKATLFDGGLRVPCLIRWPGKVAGGTTSDAVCSAIDFFPTLCSLAQVPFNSTQLDGRDLAPVLSGRGFTEPRTLVWKTGKHQSLNRDAWTALRQGDWKLVEAPGESPMLFDIASDPYEQYNLAEQDPQRLRRLQQVAQELLSDSQR